jgi:hypothetical protein
MVRITVFNVSNVFLLNNPNGVFLLKNNVFLLNNLNGVFLFIFRTYAIQEHDIMWLNHYIRSIDAEKIRFSVHCRDSRNDPTELSSTEPIIVSTIYNTPSNIPFMIIPTTTGVLRATMSQEVTQATQSRSISELSWQVDADVLRLVVMQNMTTNQN